MRIGERGRVPSHLPVDTRAVHPMPVSRRNRICLQIFTSATTRDWAAGVPALQQALGVTELRYHSELLSRFFDGEL